MAKVSEAHLEARRQSILDAAVRVFAGRGFALATMAEVAQEAGVSAGAIYRYFENKQALAMACFTEGSAQVAAQWRHQVDAAADPRSALFDIADQSFEEMLVAGAEDRTRIMLERYLEFTRGEPGPGLEALQIERSAICDALGSAIRRLGEAGQLPATLDAESLGDALYSFWLGARISRLVDPTVDTTAQLDAIRQLVEAAEPSRHAGC